MEIVNVVWLCKIMSKRYHRRYYVKTDKESVYSSSNGWLCDCGHWTTGDDNYHVAIDQGERFVYEDGFYNLEGVKYERCEKS